MYDFNKMKLYVADSVKHLCHPYKLEDLSFGSTHLYYYSLVFIIVIETKYLWKKCMTTYGVNSFLKLSILESSHSMHTMMKGNFFPQSQCTYSITTSISLKWKAISNNQLLELKQFITLIMLITHITFLMSQLNLEWDRRKLCSQ